jgi:hypothetical protein
VSVCVGKLPGYFAGDARITWSSEKIENSPRELCLAARLTGRMWPMLG